MSDGNARSPGPNELEQLAARFVHGRDDLSNEEVQQLVEACRDEPEFVRRLQDQLVVDELLRQQLDEDRGDFAAQIEQRLRDEVSGMSGGLSGLADLIPVDTSAEEGRDAADVDEDAIDLRAHAIRELEKWQRNQNESRSRFRTIGLFVGVAAVVFAATFWLLRPPRDSGTLRPDGEVVVLRGDEEIRAEERFPLEPDDEIVVPVDSTAAVEYGDGTRVEIAGGTTFRIPASSGGKGLQLELGELRASVQPQPEGRPMVVTTPTARITVLGTEFTLAVRPGGTTRLDVAQGRVALARLADDARVTVGDDEYAIAAHGTSALETHEAAFPGSEWERREPERVGLGREAVVAFAEAVGGRGCVVRDGYLVHTWGDVARRGSGSKASEAVWSHLLLLAVEDGEIGGLDESLAKAEPRLVDLDPAHDSRHPTWRHLAQHTSGYGRSEPGTAFAPDGHETALLADLLVRKIFASNWETFDEELLESRITGPIHCEDSPTLLGKPRGLLRISPRDLARFGWLHLHEGRWKGRQLLDRRLSAIATSTPVSNKVPVSTADEGPRLPDAPTLGDWPATDHYGSFSFGWWLNGVDRGGVRLLPSAPTDTFVAIAADGREGLVVIPSLDLVIAYTDAKPFAWKPGPENALDRALRRLVPRDE